MLKVEFRADDPRRAVLSHAVRRMQRENEWPTLSNKMYTDILLKDALPKPVEQAENMLLWLGNAADDSDSKVHVSCEELQATIGSSRTNSILYIANHLQSKGLLTYSESDNTQPDPQLVFQMTLPGWQEFDSLLRRSPQSRTFFMAMKFGEPELNDMVDTVFRPAVEATGYNLLVLTDEPRAGLIDDQLRVEIRRSRLLIADITHKNPGAYWEAGFAEGLGKPVIYTCRESEFNGGASHFDTNHHLTVLWSSEKDEVLRRLKATIRATLPSEAKQSD